METESTQVRLSAIGIVAISLFLALFMRLWFLQGIDRTEFEAASVSNRLRVIHEEAPRGRILDRNGRVLVDNRTSIVVALDREP
jgi:penicillin-binding protein 2